MCYTVYMVNKSWVMRVPEELNKEAFEAAHKLKVSKSEFIRQAVKEKVSKKPYSDEITDEDGIVNPWPAKPPEKKPQKDYNLLGVKVKEEPTSVFKICIHGSKVGLCKKGCKK